MEARPTLERALLRELRALVGGGHVLDRPEERLVYACDGFTHLRFVPQAVVLPASTREVAEVVRRLHGAGVPIVPRGSGTGLSGGCLAETGGVVLSLARMDRILDIDLDARRARVEAGVRNAAVTRAVESQGFFFAPDPSSQSACTIGGNVAENAGGPHTLRYGVTTNHVLGCTAVLGDGEVVELGSACEEAEGYDLTGLVVGSEGTFAIVTEVVLRLVRRPEAARTMLAVFDTMDGATEAVTGCIASGVIPSALELLDGLFLRAVEEAFHLGLPLDAAAVLLLEIDGPAGGMEPALGRIRDVLARHHVREVREAAGGAERARLWMARKKAFGAVGRLSPSYLVEDGVVPRSRLPEALRRIAAVAQQTGFRIGNVFHAGDGNLHPAILFDERDPGETRRAVEAAEEILRVCVGLGGSLTGEHGIGIGKRALLGEMFGPGDLAAMEQVRAAFDPSGRLNPGKILPAPAGCGEGRVGARRPSGC